MGMDVTVSYAGSSPDGSITIDDHGKITADDLELFDATEGPKLIAIIEKLIPWMAKNDIEGLEFERT